MPVGKDFPYQNKVPVHLYIMLFLSMTKYNSKLTEVQVFSAAGHARVGEEEETSQIQSFHHLHPRRRIPNRVQMKLNYVQLYSSLETT